MEDQKDIFSNHSTLYARYRPGYPRELFTFLLTLVNKKNAAWDCGTGNGQVAIELSNFFEQVFATDISVQQIKNAVQKKNITYRIEPAEHTSFADNSFDLITVAQAIHWFHFQRFYNEVNRVIKPKGIFAVIGYGLLKIDDTTDKIIDHFYHSIIGPYWDKERKYIDEGYATIPFPFTQIDPPVLTNELKWSLNELLGYLESWSAVQHYLKANHQNPVHQVKNELEKIWPEGSIVRVKFPILLRVAQIEK